MSKRNRLLPFWIWPSNWGLEGSRRQKAYLEYYYDGEELAYGILDLDFPEYDKDSDEYRLAKLNLDYRYHKIGEYEYGLGKIQHNPNLNEIDKEKDIARYLAKFGRLSPEELDYKLLWLSHPNNDTDEYKKELLKLDVKYGKKTEEEAQHELLDMEFPDKSSDSYKIAELKLELKFGNITLQQYEKEEATINKEPWFDVLGANYRANGDTGQMEFELDWNSYFITYLKNNGWTGYTDDDVVDKWFDYHMRNTFDQYAEEEIEPLPVASKKRDDGLTEYS